MFVVVFVFVADTVGVLVFDTDAVFAAFVDVVFVAGKEEQCLRQLHQAAAQCML